MVDTVARGLAVGAQVGLTRGARSPWSASIAAAGAYKVGDVVLKADGTGEWRCVTNGTTNNPDSATYDGWVDARSLASDPDRAAMAGRYRALAIRGVDLRQSSDRTLTSGTELTVPWVQRWVMTDTMHDTVTNNSRIVIPNTFGPNPVFRFEAWCPFRVSAAGVVPTGFRRGRILKNGSTAVGERTEPAVALADYIQKIYVDSGHVEVVPGDFVDLRVWHNHGSDSLFMASDARFMATYIGQRRGSGSYGNVVHDPNIDLRGLTGFDQVVPSTPLRVRIVDDPVLGARRQVLELWPRNADNSVTYPRAQLQSPASLAAGSNYYIGFGIYFPPDFPVYSGKASPVIHELYGPPYGGYSPTVLRVYDDNLCLAPDPLYDPDTGAATGATAIWSIPISSLRGKWVDVVRRINLSTDPAVGWQEISINAGSGYVAQTFTGAVTRYLQSTIRTGINDGGANFSSLKVAYTDYSIGACRILYTQPVVGTSFNAVAPGSY